MAVLLFGIVLALFSPIIAAAPWNEPREHDDLAPPENGFVFPFRSFHFPDQFQNISRNFYGKNQQLVFEKGNASLNAFFAIPLNQSDSVHEIYLSRDNEMEYSHDLDDNNFTLTDYYHEQRLTLFSRPEDKFSWRSFNGTTKVNIYSNTGCITYIVNRAHNGRMKIKFYTNENTTDDDMKIMKVLNEGENFDKKMCGIQVPKSLILGNYIFIPFSNRGHDTLAFHAKKG